MRSTKRSARWSQSRSSPLRRRHEALDGAYRQLRFAVGGQQVKGRLDAPAFPIAVGELVPPVPTALDPDADPTLKNPIPIA